MIAGTVAQIGICTVCAEAYGLRTDGSMRTHGWQQARHGNCPGSRRMPATSDVPLPVGIPQCGTWTGQADCRAYDPELWFSTDPYNMREAKRICRGCQVRALCLEWALDIGAKDGVFGGMDPAQRESLRRRRAR